MAKSNGCAIIEESTKAPFLVNYKEYHRIKSRGPNYNWNKEKTVFDRIVLPLIAVIFPVLLMGAGVAYINYIESSNASYSQSR